MPVTIHDIAHKANVSHTTVSRVINNSKNVKESTRQRVEEAINELNFTPSAYARGLSKSETNIIGLVVPEIRNPFFEDIIQGVTEIADKNDLNVLLYNTDEKVEKEKKVLRIVQEHRIRGLIITPAAEQEESNREHFDAFHKMQIPIVFVDRNIAYNKFDGIYFDDTKAIFDATILLLNEGHRDIVILGGNKKLKLAINRVNGYKLAYQSMHLQYNEKNIFFDDFTQESAYTTTNTILKREKLPSAIIANNNMLTLGCLKALFEKDLKIPEDIAFIGYDKIELLDILKSNISVVEKDVIQMGRNAMELLLERLNYERMRTRSIIMTAKLNAKGSEKYIQKGL
ncbi:MAG: LacI family DNA-binding transcriptional regulator [Desulfitobacterium hafniense]|nr:LacI family DNA-binding transcriptional regulator [Desulfitobacterium hafniense]